MLTYCIITSCPLCLYNDDADDDDETTTMMMIIINKALWKWVAITLHPNIQKFHFCFIHAQIWLGIIVN